MTNQLPVIFLAFANDKEDNARYLRNLPLELEGIRKALQPAVQAGLCQLVERANLTIDQLIDVFQTYKDRIAIFHYGGHADGYQLLLERVQAAGGENQAAQGAGLVSFFARQRGLQLVFFNGCSTQQQAQELSAAGVPAVIGTSNSISDDVATTLAIRFYNGMAQGHSIEKAWLEATDQVKMQQGTDNLRGFYRRATEQSNIDRFPWDIYIRQGAEKVKEWNLPEESENPLFGLPPVVTHYALPESPFLFLRRYERMHAEVFFGRSFYVRELYNKITDRQAPPVILLYGQSGTGKSSLFDAGLIPRLEHSHLTIYLRRDETLGLIGTLQDGLQQLQTIYEKPPEEVPTLQTDPLQKRLELFSTLRNQLISIAQTEQINLDNAISALERELMPVRERAGMRLTVPDEAALQQRLGDSPYANILRLWHNIEHRAGKPLVIIIDQAEELFTRPIAHLPDELSDFANCLALLFNRPDFAPQGKLLLGYRKEYHAEIEECMKENAIPRGRVFLEPLSRKDIIDVLKGLSEMPALQMRYRLQVEKDLPGIIADDLLEDKESPVAPVLQILLTKMWDKVRDNHTPVFSVALYQQLKREGYLLEDFFKQQTRQLALWNLEWEQSGLPLDILYFHTTHLGTSDSRHIDDIRKRYNHEPEKAELLIYKLKELYLLVDSGRHRTSLTHDTLAPLVRNEYRRSERNGQRAARILENQLGEFEKDKRYVLGELELATVENGKSGMRQWTADEMDLVAASSEARNIAEKSRRRRRQYAIAALSAIVITALFSLYQWNNALKNEELAKMKALMIISSQLIQSQEDTNRVTAVRLAEQAILRTENSDIKNRSEVSDNFRRVSESYRATMPEGKFWPKPYDEIKLLELPRSLLMQQSKISSGTSFTMLPSDTLPPINSYTYTPKLLSMQGNIGQVVWLPNHSFRIHYSRGERQNLVFSADSLLVKVLPIDSVLWFGINKHYQLVRLHPPYPKQDTLLQIVDPTDDYYEQLPEFIGYHNNELLIWNRGSLLRIRPKVADDWRSVITDTVFNHSRHPSFTYDSTIIDRVAVSPDLSRVAIVNAQAILIGIRDGGNKNYQWIEVADFGKVSGQNLTLSTDLQRLATSGRQHFTVYQLQPAKDAIRLNKLFSRSIITGTTSIKKVAFPTDNSDFLMVQLDDHIRMYDFNGQIVDAHQINGSTDVQFTSDGIYLADIKPDKIILLMPLQNMRKWVSSYVRSDLTIETKLAYDVATFKEKWLFKETRLLIIAQAVSFASVMLILICYIPISIHLYKVQRYYKPVMYGIAALVFLATVIYRELFTEIDDNILQNLSDAFITIGIFYMLLILFEQRHYIREYLRERRWQRLFFYTAPEIIVFAVGLFGISHLFTNKNTDELLFNISLVVFFMIINALVIWCIHLSEAAFLKKRYLRWLGLLFLPVNYLTAFLTAYSGAEFDYYFLFASFYVMVLMSTWVVRGIYRFISKRFGKKELLLQKNTPQAI
jgi:hypothetical protein